VRFERELSQLQKKGLAHYHAWAFATLRQLGSSSELMAAYVRWLGENDPTLRASAAALLSAAEAYERISAGAKTFILKAARAVNAKRALDAGPTFDDWSAAWNTASTTLDTLR
jgi:hypothetical protein